jgi:hypothetical protein
VVSPLTFAEVFLSLLALGQIEHEGDALVLASLQRCAADQDRHATAVFPEVFLLEWRADSGGGNL